MRTFIEMDSKKVKQSNEQQKQRELQQNDAKMLNVWKCNLFCSSFTVLTFKGTEKKYANKNINANSAKLNRQL